jgi:hypothetical protein
MMQKSIHVNVEQMKPMMGGDQLRSYTPEELRALLERLYGAGTDWELAARACEDFNTDQGSVYRWLQGKYRIKGTTAQVTYLLSVFGIPPR